MRYEIINGKVKESTWIDAPYDTKQDAQSDVNAGVNHACQYCPYNDFGLCFPKDENDRKRWGEKQ